MLPLEGRYEMSMAQYLLRRMYYGLKELNNDAPSWRCEVIALEHARDLIGGLINRP